MPVVPDPEPDPKQPAESPAAEDQTAVADTDEPGDFITRHVLDKDTVFFEG